MTQWTWWRRSSRHPRMNVLLWKERKKKSPARIPLELNGSNVSPFDSPVTNPVRVQLLRISAAVMRNQRECGWLRLRQRSVTRLSSATRSLTGNNLASPKERGVTGGRRPEEIIVPRGQRLPPLQTRFGHIRPPSGPPDPCLTTTIRAQYLQITSLHSSELTFNVIWSVKRNSFT